MDKELSMLTERKRFWICLGGICAVLLIVAYKAFATTQYLYPNANGPVVADGATGHWTTYGTGTSAWARLKGNDFATGVRESTVNDTCNFDFDDWTIPAGNTVSQIAVYVYCCMTGGTSATMRVDFSDGTNMSNGTATALAGPEVPPDCDAVQIVETKTTAPDGSSWDQTDINNLRLRLILTAASGSGTASVSEIDVQITYTTASGTRRQLILRTNN